MNAPVPTRPFGYWAFIIFRFNWPFYAAVALALAIGAFVLPHSPLFEQCSNGPLRSCAWLAFWLAAFWGVGSLGVSEIVYGVSKVFELDWLDAFLPSRPTRWLNIHCGFDPASRALRRKYPSPEGLAIELHAPDLITEASIQRARGWFPSEVSARTADPRRLPVADGSRDCVFLLFAAHEIRDRAARNAFFAELNRVLEAGGRVVLVEHLRDAANAAAFGPGVFHFLSRATWMEAARAGGFVILREFPLTPFVRGFVLEKWNAPETGAHAGETYE
ncbi:MAG: methyltransferase domain-containing protein [Verrucomicrobiae bacterium]|nr:methyltransferase domain-containing protein [Verrucomicrobiae bacterium]